jgi:hypothetical protein
MVKTSLENRRFSRYLINSAVAFRIHTICNWKSKHQFCWESNNSVCTDAEFQGISNALNSCGINIRLQQSTMIRWVNSTNGDDVIDNSNLDTGRPSRHSSAISTQVFLGFSGSKSECWDGSRLSKLPLHASHVALPT